MLVKKESVIYSTPLNEPKQEQNNLVPFINYQVPAPTRCIDMLLKKYNKEKFQSEVMMYAHGEARRGCLDKPLSDATIVLITDGGIVPKGNPDGMPSVAATTFKTYSIEREECLDRNRYEVVHQGYETTYVEENPSRLLPVNVFRTLEKCHLIGKLHHEFITTSGVMTSVEDCIKIGKGIAEYMKHHNIYAAIELSTCGTSTRCGSYISLAIQEADMPVVQIAQLAQIPESMGVSRVYKGSNISYPLGNVELSDKNEEKVIEKQVIEALQLFKN